MSQAQTKDIKTFVFRRKDLLTFLLFVFVIFFGINFGFLKAQNGEI